MRTGAVVEVSRTSSLVKSTTTRMAETCASSISSRWASSNTMVIIKASTCGKMGRTNKARLAVQHTGTVDNRLRLSARRLGERRTRIPTEWARSVHSS